MKILKKIIKKNFNKTLHVLTVNFCKKKKKKLPKFLQLIRSQLLFQSGNASSVSSLKHSPQHALQVTLPGFHTSVIFFFLVWSHDVKFPEMEEVNKEVVVPESTFLKLHSKKVERRHLSFVGFFYYCAKDQTF